MSNYSDIRRKKIKRHDDKLYTTGSVDDVKLVTEKKESTNDYIGTTCRDNITTYLMIAYKSKEIDNDERRMIGLCYDNVSLCKNQYYDIFHKKAVRLSMITKMNDYSVAELNEICEDILDELGVDY